MAPLKKYDTPPDIAEMWSLAEEAEAEADEAEALAAAARARARAIRLRREAELVDSTEPAAEDALSAEVRAAADGAASADVAGTQVPRQVELRKSPARKPPESEPADEADDCAPADGPASAVTQPDIDVDAADEVEVAGPARFGWLRRPKLSEVGAVLAVIVVLFSLGASVEMSVLHRNATRERAQAKEFAAAARQGVVTLTSLDFEHSKESVKRILEVSTGDFKAEFLKNVDEFTKTVEDAKVIAQGSVQATAVDLETMTENSAVVLVASTAEVTNAAGAKEEPRKYKLIVTLTRDGGQLKMSKVEFVP